MQTGREGDEDGEGGRGGVVDHADAVRSLQLIASAGILVAHGHAFWNVDASRLVHEVQGGVDADEQPALLLGPTTAVVAAAAALLAAVVALLRAVVVALLIAVVELGHQPPRPVQLNEDSPKAPRTELSQRQYPTQFRIPMSVPE